MENRQPAPKTIELINGIKSHCAEEHTNIMLMNQKLDNVERTQQEILTKLDTMDEKLDARYAKIWVQWAVQGIIVLLALSALYCILDGAGLPH
jgi:DNA-binding LacI/PurR family transcriptional regulator